MRVLADKSAKLILLRRVRDGLGGLFVSDIPTACAWCGTYDAASIEVRLQAALGPSVNSLVEGILVGLGSGISGLGVLADNVGSSSAIGGSSAGRNGVAKELGTVLADKSSELIRLGALGNCDSSQRRSCRPARRQRYRGLPLMPFLSQNSFSWDSLQASMIMSDKVAYAAWALAVALAAVSCAFK